MSTTNKIDLVIVNFKSKPKLEKLLHSITLNKLESIINNCIIYDNSNELTTTTFSKFPINIHTIINSNNVGFGKAVNIASKLVNTKYFLLINPDTKFLDQTLFDLVKHTNTVPLFGIIGGKIVFSEKRREPLLSACKFPNIFHLLFNFTIIRRLLPNNYFVKDFWYKDNSFSSISQVDCLCGAFMLINTKAFKRVHGFDEKFFLYFEDLDLCKRIIEMGGQVIYYPKAKLFHTGGYSSKNTSKINYVAWKNSRKIFVDKYFSGISKAIINFIFFIESIFF